MTHQFWLETKTDNALVLYCPTCGRRIRLVAKGKVVEVEGDCWAGHRYSGQPMSMGETDVTQTLG